MKPKSIPTELGSQDINKLLFKYAVPAIIAMTAASLYNLVDSIFIGNGVGPLAISGLAITFPFMNLAAAFGSLVGVGASTLISVKLGQKDYKTAQTILGNVISLNIIIGILFSIISLLFIDKILYFFGASEATIEYAKDYMVIILAGNIITHMYLGLNAVLRASGHPQLSMYLTIVAVIINTILDALFIYVFKWGIQGAAIATVIAQLVSLLWQVKIFTNKNELLHFKKGIYKLKKKLVKDILAIGLSPFLMNFTACFVVILINNSLKDYGGDYAIGAYGIVNRIMFFFVMVVMGLTQGMQPIVGYNYGAEQFIRVKNTLKLTIYIATIITTLGFILGTFFPSWIVSAFTQRGHLWNMSVNALKIVVMVFPIIGFQIVASNFFQSIGKAWKAIFLSLTRQLLFLIPAILILPDFFGLDGVWYSMPLSDFLACIVAGAMVFGQFRIFKRHAASLKENN